MSPWKGSPFPSLPEGVDSGRGRRAHGREPGVLPQHSTAPRSPTSPLGAGESRSQSPCSHTGCLL